MKFSAITLAVALFAAAAPVQAQQQEARQRRPARGEQLDPKQRIERRVDRLDEKLDLTDSQEAQIRAILTKEAEQLQAHFTGRGVGQHARGEGIRRGDAERPQLTPAQRDSLRTRMEQVREQTKAVREQTNAAIRNVLNAEQRTQYEKLQQEMKERGPRDGQRGKRGGERRDA